MDLVLTQPGGSLVLAGRSGIGRRTAAMLVSHMHQVNVITPKVGRGYGTKQFKADLKVVRMNLVYILLCVSNTSRILDVTLILKHFVSSRLSSS